MWWHFTFCITVYKISFGYDFHFCFSPPPLSLSLATEVVTVFVFQEPSLLSSLQDNGLTDVMLHALLIKDVSFQSCSSSDFLIYTLVLKLVDLMDSNYIAEL